MVRLLVPWDLYATVTRDGAVIAEDEEGARLLGVEEAVTRALKVLRRGGVVVIDEFQRLPERHWQLLSIAHPEGQLVLVASSLGIVARVFSRNSPLLGLVAPERIDIIRLGDAVVSLAPRLGPRRAVLWGVLLREPWLTSMPGVLRGEPWSWVAENAQLLYGVAQSLVGEVFSEEERRLTRLYDAVLRLLGDGVWDAKALAARLYERGLIESPSPSTVTGVLDKLASMGLVTRTRLWRTRGRRIYYRHASPLLGIIYGLVERHAVDEYPAPVGSLENSSLSLYSRELQFSLAELLAEHHEGLPAYTILPGGRGDVDIVVLDKRARRPLAAYEVKLGTCSREDYSKALERARAVAAERAGIICLKHPLDEPPRGLELLGPEEIHRIAVETARKITPTSPGVEPSSREEPQ